MIDSDIYHAIGNSISFRAGLMAELVMKLAEQDQRDVEIRVRMLQKAPPELREWLNEDIVLTALFCYGNCDTTINFGDEYGFKDLHDTKLKMMALRRAWENVVNIRLDEPDGTPEPHRIRVYLAAVM